jgi:hypothetical protein
MVFGAFKEQCSVNLRLSNFRQGRTLARFHHLPLLITDTKLSNSEFNTSESLKSSELLKVDTAAS